MWVLLLLAAAVAAVETPSVARQETLRSALPLSADRRAQCGDLVCTAGETRDGCPGDCDPFRVAWRGCVGMLEPPSAGCLQMMPSAATLRLAALDGEKARACAAFTRLYDSAAAATPPPRACTPPTDDGQVPEGVLLPDSGGVVLPPRPEGAPWGVKSVWREDRRRGALERCKACGTHPKKTRAYSQDEASLVVLESGRVLHNPRAALSDAALERARAVRRRPAPPHVLVVVLDGASECHARLGSPLLAEMAEGRGEGLEGLGIYPLRNFHRLGEMTTYEHMTLALGGVRQVEHKHHAGADTRHLYASLSPRWIWTFLRDQGYITTNVGNRVASKSYARRWIDEQFDTLIPARLSSAAHSLCLGGQSEPSMHLQWMDELAAAVEADAPLFGLVHEFHQHPPLPTHAVVFETLVETLPAILRRSNTVVVLMGDHGQTAIRDWPLLSLMASEQTWAGVSARVGRDVPSALRDNADRLVGHYDVYETLRELGEAHPGSRFRAPMPKGVRRFLPWAGTKARSLLGPVGDRTLLEVGVSPLLMLRGRPRPLDEPDPRVAAALVGVVDEMNAAVANASVWCPRLALERVHGVARSELDEVAAFTVQFSVTPGSFLYEAMLLQVPGNPELTFVDFPTRVGDRAAFVAMPLSMYAVNEGCAGGPALARLCLCGVAQ